MRHARNDATSKQIFQPQDIEERMRQRLGGRFGTNVCNSSSASLGGEVAGKVVRAQIFTSTSTELLPTSIQAFPSTHSFNRHGAAIGQTGVMLSINTRPENPHTSRLTINNVPPPSPPPTILTKQPLLSLHPPPPLHHNTSPPSRRPLQTQHPPTRPTLSQHPPRRSAKSRPRIRRDSRRRRPAPSALCPSDPVLKNFDKPPSHTAQALGRLQEVGVHALAAATERDTG